MPITRNINDDVTIFDAQASYFSERLPNGALKNAESVGAASTFKLTLNTEKKEFKAPNGRLIKVIYMIPSASASMTLHDISPSNLARAVKATLVPKAAAVGIQKEVGATVAGQIAFLDAVNVSNVVIKDGEAVVPADTYVLDPKFGSITFNSVLAAASVTFDTAEQNVYSLLTAPNAEFDIKIQILDLGTGKPRILHLYRVAVSPTKDLDVIGEDWASLTLELDVLEDPTKPEDPEFGRYGRFIG